MKKSYIWSLPTRVFHWLFVVCILLAFITAEEDRLLNYHVIIGYIVLILLLFRLVWGVFGTKYSRFKDFPLSMKNAKEFIFNIFNKEQKFVGHNPLASYVMIAMFITVFLIIVSGIFTLGIQEGKGIFSSLNLTFFKNMELFEESHEVLATFLIILIISHLGGIVFDRLLHSKHETLQSIFTGYKRTKKDESVQLNLFQKSIVLLFVILFVLFMVYNIIQPKNILVSSMYTPINYEYENELFVSECASCHTLYPPHLLSKKSWHLLMSDLENHFGDDASLDREDHNNILSFLLQHSAETSTMEASKKILDSIENKDIITISKTTFWKERHAEIPKEVFLHEEIKSKANCKACHIDIEKGLIEDENIKSTSNFK